MPKVLPVRFYFKIILIILVLVFSLLIVVVLHGMNFPFWNERGSQKYDSIVSKAANANDPSICDQINFGRDYGDYSTSASQSRYFCRADYAIATSDVDYCRSLDADVKYAGTISQRNACLRGLAIKLKVPKLCEEMLDQSGTWYTEQYIKGCKDSIAR